MEDSKEYFIWCDESLKKGKYFSNFYGGLLIRSNDLKAVLNKLEETVNEIGITEEIKWQKIDAVKVPAFEKLINTLFDLVKEDKIKIRIMFTQNTKVPTGLNNNQKDNSYFLLYYQFFKHAFGFSYSNSNKSTIHLRVHFDYLPDTISKSKQFKEHIKGLESSKGFKDAGIKIRKNDIVEIDSKKHLPLQFLDVVLGAMQFRLNDKHKEKPEGKYRRGKRTIAKEKIYKLINKRIREIKQGFNIGVSTAISCQKDKWEMPYRHWCFKPKNYVLDETKSKKKGSIPPT